jgi:hypothetical protein
MGGPGQPGLPKRDVDDSLLEEARKGRPLDAKSARARRGKDGKPTAKPAPGRAAPRASSSRTETPRTGGPRKPGGPRTGGPKTGGPKTGGPRKPGGRG